MSQESPNFSRETVLDASKEIFQQLVENIVDEVFWLASPDQKQLFYVSPSYEKVFGRTCYSLYKDPFALLRTIDPQEHREVEHLLDKQQQGQGTSVEYRIQRPDGTERWILTRTFPIGNSNHSVQRVAGFSQDITSRKCQELAQELKKRQNRELLSSSTFLYGLQKIQQHGCRLMEWSLAEAWIPSPDGQIMVCSDIWHCGATDPAQQEKLTKFHYFSQEFTFPLGQGLPGRVWLFQQPEWLPDLAQVSQENYLRVQQVQQAGLKSSFALPILLQNQVLAVLIFYGDRIKPENPALISFINDMTELSTILQGKQTQLALQAKEQKYQRIFENAVDGIFQTTPEQGGRYLTANPMLSHIYGYSSPEELINSLTNINHQLYVDPQKREELGRLLAEKGTVWGFESQVYRKDGEIIWISENVHEVRDATGKLLYYEGSVEDITKRKQGEEEIRRLNAELEQRVSDRTLALQTANKELTKEIAERTKTEAALRASEAQLRRQAEELQETINKLQNTQAQLVHSEKISSLGQLVAGVAHEVNNPVGFISGNLRYAEEYSKDLLHLIRLYQERYPDPGEEIIQETEEIELDFLAKDLPRIISSMQVGIERIRDTMQSLRNFSRLDEAELKPVDIHSGIESTLMILQHRLKAKAERPAIEVVKNYADLPLVECYAGQLNQVFMNILANGVDALEEYNQERGKTYAELEDEPNRIIITTSREVGEKEDWIIIQIADNGPGISPACQQKMFNAFFTTKPVGKGTGLGLSISYQIVVEQHGGTLECLSKPGGGTEFMIKIPRQLSLDN